MPSKADSILSEFLDEEPELTGGITTRLTVEPKITETADSILDEFTGESPIGRALEKDTGRDLLPKAREFAKESADVVGLAGQEALRLVNEGKVPQGVFELIGGMGAAGATGGVGALAGAGALQQRSESSRVDALRLAMGQPLPPEGTISEFGDVFQEAGFGPKTSAALGLVTEAVTDPAAFIAGLPSKTARLAMLGSSRALGKAATTAVTKSGQQVQKQTAKVALAALQRQQPETLRFMFKDGFRSMSRKFRKLSAPEEMADGIIKRVDDLHEAGSKAWDDVSAEAVANTPIPDKQSLVQRLDDLRQASLSAESDLRAINRASASLGDKGLDLADDLASEIGESGVDLIRVIDNVNQSTSLKDVIRIQRQLSKQAKTNVNNIKASRIISNHLKDVSPEFAEASAKWARFSEAARLRDKVIGKVSKEAGELQAEASQKLTTLFSGTGAKMEKRLNRLSAMLGDDLDLALTAKRLSAGREFNKRTGGISGIFLGGAEKLVGRTTQAVQGGFDIGLTPRQQTLLRILDASKQVTLDPAAGRLATGRSTVDDVFPETE